MSPSETRMDTEEASDVGGGHVSLGSTAATAASTPARRVLAAKSSRERSPRRTPDDSSLPSPSSSPAAAAPAAGSILAQGRLVTLTRLTSRPELDDVQATVLSFDRAAGRYAVRHPTGEQMRVRPGNLRQKELATA